ncbi:MAG: ROK family protein [Chloroflexota bacterium]
MSDLIAVDLGGTSIRVARFSADGPPPLAQVKTPTQASEGPEAVVRRIIQTIERILPAGATDLRIGVGAPGPLDPRRGIILEAPNLPGWTNFPLRDMLQQHFGLPVAVGNDANLAALGEWRFGAGRGTQDLLYLTISTGIGGGVITDGRLLIGANGLAAELGHMTVDPNGPLCGCGLRGHLEAVASGPAIARRARELIESGRPSTLTAQIEPDGGLTAEAVGEAARLGDPLAREVLAEAGEAIGRHLASLVHAFNPEIIVLGGGVTHVGPLLFEPIERALRAGVLHPAYLQSLRLVPAALGDDAGLIGAMVLESQL